MEEFIIPPSAEEQNKNMALDRPNPVKPVWVNPQMNCDQCQYNDQDVDTFPCAKCHTRN